MSDRRHISYGEAGVTWVDRFGVWLSQRAIRRRLPRGKPLEILELGCGYRATQLVALRDRVSKATCVDFKLAPELKSDERLEPIESTIEDALARLAGRTFDAVLLISVLEHLADAPAVLARIHDLVRPGGVLFLNVPTWRGKYFLELSAFRLGTSAAIEMDDHKMYYDKRDLWPLLVRAGFKPSGLSLRYHKFGLNLFATARRTA